MKAILELTYELEIKPEDADWYRERAAEKDEQALFESFGVGWEPCRTLAIVLPAEAP